MTESVIVKNFENYKRALLNYFDEEVVNRLFESVNGEEAIMKAPFSNQEDSGSAYEGALVRNIIRLAKTAININNLFPENIRANEDSIYKVSLLSHISKAIMYVENTNAWEIENRGMNYKFAPLSGALRYGERSILLCMNAGIKFNETEFEAMRIMDKSDNDDYSKYYSSPLSMVIKIANEMITTVNRNTK